MDSKFSYPEVLKKMEYYCAYQERCHYEIYEKSKTFSLTQNERDELMVYLIEHNFLNGKRFAKNFVRGKHEYKKWGKVRLINELKSRKISSTLIQMALKELDEDKYEDRFNHLAEKIWETTNEKNLLKKRKKCCDFLLRKGFESDWVYEKIKELENKK